MIAGSHGRVCNHNALGQERFQSIIPVVRTLHVSVSAQVHGAPHVPHRHLWDTNITTKRD